MLSADVQIAGLPNKCPDMGKSAIAQKVPARWSRFESSLQDSACLSWVLQSLVSKLTRSSSPFLCLFVKLVQYVSLQARGLKT